MTTEAQLNLADPLPCPHCGYDLRGTAGHICTSCGRHVDRESLRQTQIPWAHRREIGRVRAYIQTAWIFTFGSRTLTHEHCRPQNSADARAFRRVTACIISAAFLSFFAGIVYRNSASDLFAIERAAPLTANFDGSSPLIVDYLLPASAGCTLWPLFAVYLVGFAIYLSGIQRRIFMRGRLDPQYHQINALSSYVSAPFAIFLPIIVISTGTLDIIDHRNLYPSPPVVIGILLIYVVLIPVMLIVTLGRVAQWFRRATYGGLTSAFIAAGKLIFLWLVGAGVWFVLIPWCTGVIILAVLSFR